LTQEDYKAYKEHPYVQAGERVYQDLEYIIFHYDNAEEFFG